MTTMIEKLAQAIQRERDNQCENTYFYDRADTERLADGRGEWMEFQGGVKLADSIDRNELVRACLTALLEPTEGMVEAGECGPYSDGHPSDIEPTARQVFAAMIRAALEEKE